MTFSPTRKPFTVPGGVPTAVLPRLIGLVLLLLSAFASLQSALAADRITLTPTASPSGLVLK